MRGADNKRNHWCTEGYWPVQLFSFLLKLNSAVVWVSAQRNNFPFVREVNKYVMQLSNLTLRESGPFPAILGKGPWLELGKNMRHFGNFFRSVNC